MHTPKGIVASFLLLLACPFTSITNVVAQPLRPERLAKAKQLLEKVEKMIQGIMKDQESACHAHDMKVFTKSFRDDADGINVGRMYWRGNAVILTQLTDEHDPIFKDFHKMMRFVRKRQYRQTWWIEAPWDHRQTL